MKVENKISIIQTYSVYVFTEMSVYYIWAFRCSLKRKQIEKPNIKFIV